MKHTTGKWSTLLGACAVAVLGVAGCADRNKNDIPESPATGAEIERSMDKAGDAASNAASSVAEAGKNLDDAATITPKVKTALGANASLAGSKINVSTSDQSVRLDGTVKNDAQKNVAGQIASKNAPGYKIVNNLKVTGGASPVMNKKP